MKLYYMRDNHTFRPLPLDVDQAIAALREEFSQGCPHGMLCTQSISIDPVHAHGRERWPEFERKASLWLFACIHHKSPADREYESWATHAHGVEGQKR